MIQTQVQPEFWHTALQRNRLFLIVICVMIFGMELFNIVQVLFWSKSGLSMLNNHIYFGPYCALLAVAVVYLLLSVRFRRGWIGVAGCSNMEPCCRPCCGMCYSTPMAS